MKLRTFNLSFIFILLVSVINGQSIEDSLDMLSEELEYIAQQQRAVEGKIENLKLERIQRDLQTVGLPAGSDDLPVVCHSALCLAYDEVNEQARWVAHVITPEMMNGTVARTNDFRVDSLVLSGTTEEADFFMKYLQPDKTYEYDGYGYDRGHLAPSADFRWSTKALSESYYYSNMSPQLPEFNREKWAELEGAVRGYVYRNPEAQLYVVTGPLIDENAPVVERSVNRVSIPSFFWKVVVDLNNKKGIGFIMPHKNLTSYPLASFAVTIDQVENTTGLNFFPEIEDELEKQIESNLNKEDWLPAVAAGDKEPLYAPDLPRNHFNTVQAKRFMNRGEKINVCGTVVGARTSRKGNVLINLDKQYPNQIFTVFIRKENLVNFSYNPEEDLKSKEICVSGEVGNLGGKATMFIEKEEEVRLYEEE